LPPGTSATAASAAAASQSAPSQLASPYGPAGTNGGQGVAAPAAAAQTSLAPGAGQAAASPPNAPYQSPPYPGEPYPGAPYPGQPYPPPMTPPGPPGSWDAGRTMPVNSPQAAHARQAQAQAEAQLAQAQAHAQQGQAQTQAQQAQAQQAQAQPTSRLLAIEPPRSDETAPGTDKRRPGENTRSVHLPLPTPAAASAQLPFAIPIYRSPASACSSALDYAPDGTGTGTNGSGQPGSDNPTVAALCSAIAAMEGINLSYPACSQAFASGMAAISTIFWAFTRAGTQVVAPAGVYGGTYGFLRNVAANFGVQTDFVDMTDLRAVQAALRPGSTAVLYAETLASSSVAVADLGNLARLAHQAGALFVVDSTLAPPVICRPLEHGADLVLHSASKYFGGHSDVSGGVVTGRAELIRPLGRIRIDTGGSLAPDDAYMLRRGLETLPLRVRRQCATAQVLAAGLAMHPAVSGVCYPGLTAHLGHELARRQFDAGPEGTRFGATVTVVPYGGSEAGAAFAQRLQLAQMTASPAGTHTKVSHMASTTHRLFDPAALAQAGIDQGAVRFSVGLEDGEDLLADAMAALDSLGRR
jgi:cystathionine beta-lyase/cystathionine gamma-synthase